MERQILLSSLFASALLTLNLTAANRTATVSKHQPELASPLQHWVYNLPSQVQARPVSVTVTVGDRDGRPVPAEVVTLSQPWGYRQHRGTDTDGRLVLSGPLGQWLFHATLRTPQGPVLVGPRWVTVSNDCAVALTVSTQEVHISISDAPPGKDLITRLRQRPFPLDQGALYPTCCFVPLQFAGLCPTMSGGSFSPGAAMMDLRADPAADFLLGLVAPPFGREPGYAVWARHRPGSGLPPRIDEGRLATVEVTVGTSWPDVHLEIIGMSQEEVPVYLYVPLRGTGTFQIRVPPGLSRFGLRTRHGGFVPVTRSLPSSGRTQLAFRGPFSARPEVLRWDRQFFSVWFDVLDSAGNYIHALTEATAHLTLKREREIVFDGPVTRSCGRVIEVQRDWGETWAQTPIDFEFRLNSLLTGPILTQGQLLPDHVVDRKLTRVHQTELFEVYARERTPNGVQVAEAFQKAHDALAATIAGPVKPSNGGRFRIQFTSPFGLAWSSGDTVGLDIYAAHWFWPMANGEAMVPALHEFGHSYSLVPPRNQPLWGESEGQTFATWLAYQALRGAFGQRAYQTARINHNSELLSTPPDQPFDGLMFVMDYVDQRFGTAINRHLYRLLYTGEGDLRSRVERLSELKTQHERLAVLHSKLTSQNLAWLYRWAHLKVSDETVDRGLQALN